MVSASARILMWQHFSGVCFAHSIKNSGHMSLQLIYR